MSRALAIITTLGLLWIGGAALADPMNPPTVETVDCARGLAVIVVSVDEGHYVLISDGDGFTVRIDGPADQTLELATGSYTWSGFGLDDLGRSWNKGQGSFETVECAPIETTTTVAIETTSTTAAETTTTVAAETTTIPVETTVTTEAETTTTTETSTSVTDATFAPTETTFVEATASTPPATVLDNTVTTGVADTSLTTVPTVTASTLPFTGPTAGDLGLLAIVGVLALLIGVAMLIGPKPVRGERVDL